METLKALGRNTLKTAAPVGLEFENSRRIVRSNAHRTGKSVLWWIMCLASAAVWLYTWIRERKYRRALLLTSGTRQTNLRELKLALRLPASNSHLQNAEQHSLPQITPAEAVESISLSVHHMSGQVVLGSVRVKNSDLVSELKDRLVEVLRQPAFALRLVYLDRELEPSISFGHAGVLDGAVLTVVISKERVDVAEKLFARVVGEVWVPNGQRVRAPFSLEWVAYFEATTIRLYDEWVTRTTKRLVKSRRKGSGSDPGSDSEYEEVETSSWESREEVQHRQMGMAPHLYIQDVSTEKARIVFKDAPKWGSENSVLSFQETQNNPAGVGGALMAFVGHERERGIRREEKCISLGECLEVVGEACKTEDCLILRDLTVPSDNLHRIDSDGFTNPSKLRCKTFQGAILRNNESLQDFSRIRAVWCRVGKWIFGTAFSGLAYFIAYGIWIGRRTRMSSKRKSIHV